MTSFPTPIRLASPTGKFWLCPERYLSALPEASNVRQMVGKVTVLLVDDHALVRRGFRRLLEDEECISVVGEADNGVRAVEMVRELNPKVVLMDCSMPGGDGVAATREISRSHPHTSVLMLSMHSEDALVRRAIEAGARGFILKNAFDLDLVPAIKRVVAGELVLDRQLSASPEAEVEEKRTAGLTARELEVLQLIVDGRSSRDIADLLQISQNTVSAHRTRIFRTLGCHSRRTGGVCDPQRLGTYPLSRREHMRAAPAFLNPN